MIRWLAAALAAMPMMATAQSSVLLEDLDPSIANVLVAEGGQVDTILTWDMDFAGDTSPDRVVQAAIAYGGGNAFFLVHYLFERRNGGYALIGQPELPGGIKALRRVGDVLEFTVFEYRDGDGRCCPSGEAVVMVRP